MVAERGGILPTKKCPKIEFILSSCGGEIGSSEKPDKFRKKWSKFDGKPGTNMYDARNWWVVGVGGCQ